MWSCVLQWGRLVYPAVFVANIGVGHERWVFCARNSSVCSSLSRILSPWNRVYVYQGSVVLWNDGGVASFPTLAWMGAKKVRGSLFRTSHRRVDAVQHRETIQSRCSAPFVSQIRSLVVCYGTSLPGAQLRISCHIPTFDALWPPVYCNLTASFNTCAGRSHGAYPDTRSTANASASATSTP
jgi:hypothetical protein